LIDCEVAFKYDSFVDKSLYCIFTLNVMPLTLTLGGLEMNVAFIGTSLVNYKLS